MEKLSFRKTSDLAKMIGTVICITGAVTMSLYKGIAIYQRPTGQDELHHGFELLQLRFVHLGSLQFEISYYALGMLCLFLNCTSWALYLIHQVHIPEHKAPFQCCPCRCRFTHQEGL
jgi:hypothetical protein